MFCRLSGLSPFLGEADEENLANVAAADWDFDDPAWDDITDLGKDFICRLMVKDRRYAFAKGRFRHV